MQRHTRAFTLLELLLTIAIMAILIGLVAVSLGGLRDAANRTDSLNSLRQLTLGYTSYSTDHNTRLMPGYLSISLVNSLNIRARTQHGEIVPAAETRSYVWRLSPYLDHQWSTMLNDYKDEQIAGDATAAVEDGIYGPNDVEFDPQEHFPVSSQPSFGMNSIYVGGDAVHGGDAVVELNPFDGAAVTDPNLDVIAATRMSEVTNPSKLIVFGSAARQGNGDYAPYATEEQIGYAELRAPYTIYDPSASEFTNQQWDIGNKKQVVAGVDADLATDGGLPVMRWSDDLLPVANLDGSTEAADIGALSEDMRRWAWQETGLSAPAMNP